MRRASSASTSLPVRRISAELEVPTARGRSQLTPSSVPVSPLLMPAPQNTADSAGQPDVGPERKAHAPAVGRSLDGGDDRLGDGPHGRDDAAHELHGPHAHPVAAEVLGARRQPGVLELEARAEGPAGAGEDHHPAAVVGGHLVEGGVQVRHQGEGHGVEPGRVVEGHHPDVGARPSRWRRVPWAQPHRRRRPAPLAGSGWAIIGRAAGAVQRVRALRGRTRRPRR